MDIYKRYCYTLIKVLNMKRFLPLLSFAPVLLLLSCNLQMPSAVQIKGSPDLRFAARFDMGDYLAGLFNGFGEDKDDDKIELLDCEKTSVVTYLVYMKLYDEKIPLAPGMFPGAPFTAPVDKDIELTKGYLEVEALDFGDFLEGFSFNQAFIVSKIYISGSPIVNGLSVELKIKGDSIVNKGNMASGLKGKKDIYDKTALPEGGKPINLPFSGDKFTIDYTIFVNKGDTIEGEWITADPSVLIELAVWLPFEFKADYTGAELKMPGDLFSEGDLFGRESPDSGNTVTEMLESLSLAMKMSTNPFTGASLKVESRGINIENPIRGASLEFAINEQNMKAINSPANFPFAPKLKIVFIKDGRLSFPRQFIINEIAFNAKLNHTIDLSGGIN